MKPFQIGQRVMVCNSQTDHDGMVGFLVSYYDSETCQVTGSYGSILSFPIHMIQSAEIPPPPRVRENSVRFILGLD